MDDSTARTPWKLQRRNSISTSVLVPTKLSLLSPTTTPPTSTTTTTNHHHHLQGLHSSSFPAQNGVVTPAPPPKLDLELLSLKGSESYTSLKDLLPSSAAASPAVNSPTAASAANSGYEISIRNRLVKQAAWAYLQPMSSTSGPSGSNFIRRLCLKLSPCLSFFSHGLLPFLSQTFRRTLCCIGLTT